MLGRIREALQHRDDEDMVPGMREELEKEYAAVAAALWRLVILEESQLGWLETYRRERRRTRLRSHMRLYLYRWAERAARADIERLRSPQSKETREWR